MEAWIREKELLVSQGDLGKDYEHCMELQRKLNDAGSGATRGVDKERIEAHLKAHQALQAEIERHKPQIT